MNLDFETFSEAGYMQKPDGTWKPSYNKGGIGAIGAVAYAKHPSTRILSLAYGRKLWLPGMPPPVEIWESGEVLEAFNAPFECAIWFHVAHKRLGWPDIPLSRWSCTAARSRVAGLPHSLEAVAKLAGVEKDPIGEKLIPVFCYPGKRFREIRGDREELAFYAYNGQDVVAESAISQLLPPLNDFERRVWEMDTRINQRGIAVDMDTVRNFQEIVRYVEAQGDAAMGEITGVEGTTVNSVKVLREWAAEEGVDLPDMSKATVAAMLKDDTIPESVRDMLEVRAETAVASTKKLAAITARAVDGRLHDLYMYWGAHTGRVAGRGPQPANLPRGELKVSRCTQCGAFFGTTLATCPNGCQADKEEHEWSSSVAEAVIESARVLPPELFINRWGSPLRAISGSIRAVFVAAPGKILTCSDYNSIEARALSMVSGEEWRIDVFRTHGKIYESSAAKIFGIPMEAVKKGSHERSCGKVAELALGYGGWVNALKAFGADKYMTEEQMEVTAREWRQASPMVVRLWMECHNNFVMARLNPGQWFTYRDLAWFGQGSDVIMRLPSGGYRYYRDVQLTPPKFGAKKGYLPYDISYMGWNTNRNRGPYGWARMFTRGSRITENVMQAVCRDIQMAGMLKLEAAGYLIVMHTYDENIAETDKDFGSVEEFERIMADMDPWAADWPIKASDGWRGVRYRK